MLTFSAWKKSAAATPAPKDLKARLIVLPAPPAMIVVAPPTVSDATDSVSSVESESNETLPFAVLIRPPMSERVASALWESVTTMSPLPTTLISPAPPPPNV